MNTTSAPIQEVPKSGLSITSMVLGILGILGLSCLTGLPALITGHIAMSRIKASHDTIGGHGMALTGTILGYLSVLLIPVIAVLAGLATPAILKAKKNADYAKMVNEVKIVGLDLDEFAATDARYPTVEEFSFVTKLPEIPYHMNGSWIYFPAANPEENTPILISPATRGKHAVLYTDISVQDKTEDEVIQILQTSDAEPVEFEATIREKP